MSGWNAEDVESILVGDRRMRVRRRRTRPKRVNPWMVLAVVVALAAAGVGVFALLTRTSGSDAPTGPTIVAPGGFQAKIGAEGTITVALEIRNVTDDSVTVIGARVVTPSGLTQMELAVMPLGEQNQNLNLDAELPPSAPVTLGTIAGDRNAIVAARFRVDCDRLPPTTGATGEQIFVTVQLGTGEREEELTPPVVGGIPWLTATARNACAQPTVTGSAEPPLPPL